jgi:hypothetical protein
MACKNMSSQAILSLRSDHQSAPHPSPVNTWRCITSCQGASRFTMPYRLKAAHPTHHVPPLPTAAAPNGCSECLTLRRSAASAAALAVAAPVWGEPLAAAGPPSRCKPRQRQRCQSAPSGRHRWHLQQGVVGAFIKPVMMFVDLTHRWCLRQGSAEAVSSGKPTMGFATSTCNAGFRATPGSGSGASTFMACPLCSGTVRLQDKSGSAGSMQIGTAPQS